MAQSDVAGSNGYGKFSIDAAGAWTYTMDGAHDEFVGGADYTDSITVATADGTTQVLTVTMHGTNDAPINTVPGAQVTNEDTSKAITGLSIADGGVSNTVTLSVTHGSLAVTGGAGVVVAGSGSASVTLTGSVAAINAALAAAGGVIYTPAANYNGGDTLTMVTSNNAAAEPTPIPWRSRSMRSTDNPVAVADRVIVSNSTAVTIAASSLLGNDTDIDGLALQVTGVSNARRHHRPQLQCDNRDDQFQQRAVLQVRRPAASSTPCRTATAARAPQQ